MEIFDLDIVQAPLNVIDRRLEISGVLSKLKKLNVEVHTRSTFLQGLFIVASKKFQLSLIGGQKFGIIGFKKLKENNLNPIEACLSYPMSLAEVDRIVIGVNDLHQLKTIIKLAKSKIVNQNFPFMISNDNLLINPSKWENI